MASELDELRMNQEQIANNKARRLPLCLCVDASTSMSIDRRMRTVNRELGRFLQNMENTATARDAVEVCVVAFGDGAQVKCDFGSPAEALRASQELRAVEARTELGAGVLLALDRLELRLRLLSGMGISCYRPWLILISDGEATDVQRCQEAGAQVQELLRKDRLRVKCLSLSGEEESLRTLRDFTLNGQVDQVDSLEMADFFELLSRSVSRASRQSIQRGDFDLSGCG